MHDDELLRGVTIPEVLPLFPLPHTVLLPGEVLPLHVFEPRYRDLVRDILAGHRLLGIIDSAAGGSTADAASSAAGVGCLGRIAYHHPLPDGRSLIWVLGVSPVSVLGDVEAETLYRQARVRVRTVARRVCDGPALLTLRRRLIGLLERLVEVPESGLEGLTGGLDGAGDSQLVAITALVAGLPADRRQRLLEASSLLDRFLLLVDDLGELRPELAADLGPDPVH